MAGKLEHKVAVVTGGGRGIGRGIAIAFAREGAAVVVADLDGFAGDAVAAEITKNGATAWARTTDVTDPDAVSGLVEETLGQFGSVHVLVNNAGIGTASRLVDMSLDEWQRMITVDLTSVFLCCRACLPVMIHQRWGRIINMGSQLALKGAEEMVHYCAAKSGVHGFTRALARELAEYNITVNVVAPGPIETALLAGLPPTWAERMRAALPVGRFGTVEEVAPTAVLLASEDGAYYTGSTLNVSGGDVMV